MIVVLEIGRNRCCKSTPDASSVRERRSASRRIVCEGRPKNPRVPPQFCCPSHGLFRQSITSPVLPLCRPCVRERVNRKNHPGTTRGTILRAIVEFVDDHWDGFDEMPGLAVDCCCCCCCCCCCSGHAGCCFGFETMRTKPMTNWIARTIPTSLSQGLYFPIQYHFLLGPRRRLLLLLVYSSCSNS